MAAVATRAEIFREIDHLELQPLVVLVDAALPCSNVLVDQLRVALVQFFEVIPRSVEQWHGSEYQHFVKKQDVDNWGRTGSRTLLTWLKIPRAPPDFCQRGVARMAEALQTPRPSNCDVMVFRRIFCYAEYDGGPARGILAENGMSAHGVCLSKKPTHGFKAMVLPINPFVDRNLCAEYQMFTEMCDTLPRHWKGCLRIILSMSPCVSCLGLMVQFLQRYPGARLELSNQDEDEAFIDAPLLS
eukprot:gnl/MRDRNA2_/MRDRNA2_83424_c0_seq1.p1 gnl/MRDRNA2_/MRDRNA2_83424_c0~~gnl/MRDRNA2_/MRDRNA2_83424_c0_seq1.p1  ORF type:complete len:284 (-),score=40.90 gnl/MRDRNA2_/MRDRNA2_83424_c0_seq1:72-800(-)